MSDTPRTDAHIEGLRRNPQVSGCDSTLDFSRQLERELTEARTRIKELADIGGALANPWELQDCKCSDCRQWRRATKDWHETVKRCLEGIE